MDNFLGTVVFLLPGFLAYFWLQAFGINPVAKHSPTEFTAIAGLLWLPVSFCTLILYNLVIWLSSFISQAKPIWTLLTLKDASNNFTFLIVFLLLSVLVSFICSYIWSLWGFKLQQELVNWVRTKRGLADFSDTTSVWDKVFGKDEIQVIEISGLDNTGGSIIGEIENASRPFETERNFCLAHIELFTRLVNDNKEDIKVINTFIDTKSNIIIKVFDKDALEVLYKEEQRLASISSSESETEPVLD
ncbi:MAG TPA: DUF6338 family protein [Desulfosporosinus sp.]